MKWMHRNYGKMLKYREEKIAISVLIYTIASNNSMPAMCFCRYIIMYNLIKIFE